MRGTVIAHRVRLQTRVNFVTSPPEAVAQHVYVWERPAGGWKDWPKPPFYGRGVIKRHHPTDYREVYEFFDPRYPENILAVMHLPITLTEAKWERRA